MVTVTLHLAGVVCLGIILTVLVIRPMHQSDSKASFHFIPYEYEGHVFESRIIQALLFGRHAELYRQGHASPSFQFAQGESRIYSTINEVPLIIISAPASMLLRTP